MTIFHKRFAIVSLLLAVVSLVGGLPTDAAASETDAEVPYVVQVRWTSFGIPHVRASNWGSLGYGYGYAFARDNVCTLARDVIESNGQLSRFFGPDGGKLESDFVWALLNSDAETEANFAELDRDMQELVRGYAAGYNRHLRDTGASALPTPCRDADWVRPITELDVMKVLNKLNLRAGVANFIDQLVGAQPPATTTAAMDAKKAAPAATAGSAAEAQRLLAQTDLPTWDVHAFGSNAVALGRDLTNDGQGALLGNPHFPWFGMNRFHAVHLTIPGRYDAMGAAIYGFPLVSIGFNRFVAWSHTVSTARRFVVRELTLAPDDPTSYVYNGDPVPMTTETVTVEVLQSDKSLASESHTFYLTQFGPMVDLGPLAGWGLKNGYAFTDVNVGNVRGLKQYREMGSARGIGEFEQAIKSHVALPWVNTIAADRHGNAYYGDISTVPHVTDAKLFACANTVVARTLSFGARIYTLDGSTSACDLGSDPDAPQAGIFGAGNLPSIRRDDYAQNSNNSYWLANPAEPLEGFPQIIGTDEGGQQNLRTRLGITQIEDRMAGPAGLPGSGFDRQWLQDVLYQNRNHSAELLLDGVLTLCDEEDNEVDVGGGNIVDVSEACTILGAWDGTNDPDRVGPHIWRELYDRIAGIDDLYGVPFDANDPVNTPRDLNVEDPDVRSQVMAALADTVQRLADASIPLNRAWGAVHFDTRPPPAGETFPIHGGPGGSGVYNAISSGGLIEDVGYTPIFAGSSYIQTVRWVDDWPDVRAIVTYSQSTDPDSPHFSDMTRVFSDQGWVAFPYQMGDIQQDLIEDKFLQEQR
jgi:acyl-homoserine-lactone acylase